VSQTRLYQTAITGVVEHKQAERQVRELTELLDQVPDAVLVRDLEDRVLFWNKSAERLYGWMADEALGQDIRHLHYRADPLQLEEAKSAVLCKGEWQGEMRLVTKDGRDLIADCRWRPLRDEAGQPNSVLVVNTDITEKKKLEAQLLRTQRLEIIGELASGIAHDLNNLLSPILMAGSMLEQKNADEQTRRWLGVISRNALLGSDLVKQMMPHMSGQATIRVSRKMYPPTAISRKYAHSVHL
jgi:PAS domain S-box-containing protein